jgi:hypothetical protein
LLQVEVLNEVKQKSLKELQENKNKTNQDLKMKVETIKKTQRETTLEIEKRRKETRNHRCEHQQKNTIDGRENIRCRRFHREHGDNNQRK